MHKHNTEKHHGDTNNKFRIKREKIDQDPIRRILRESIRIEKAEKDKSKIVMNSKDEHFGVQTVRGTFGTDWNEEERNININ